MARIEVELNRETYLKLTRRAARVGLTPEEAVKILAKNGVAFFLAKLVGATNSK